MDFSPLLILLFGGLIGWLFRHWRSADELAVRRRDDRSKQMLVNSVIANSDSSNHTAVQAESSQSIGTPNGDASINGVALTVIEQELDELYQLSAKVKPLEYELNKSREQLKRLKSIQEATCDDLDDTWVTLQEDHVVQDNQISFVGFLSDSDYAVHVTSDESAPDEIGELYQLVAKVKPLQYELAKIRKFNNSLAADKERVERRLRSQLELNNQQQEAHKLELARGLASQSTLKDTKIAELQARVEKAERESAEFARQSAELLEIKTDQEQLTHAKQQLIEEHAVQQALLQARVEKAERESAELARQSAELLEIKTDQEQLTNAKQQLIEEHAVQQALLQARVEKAESESAEFARQSAELLEIRTDQEQLTHAKQQLIEEHVVQQAVLEGELKSLQEHSTRKHAETDAVVLQQKTELHSLQLQTEDQKIQLYNANKRLGEIYKKQATEVETRSNLQKTLAVKDEQIGKLSTQLDELSQTNSAALRDKDEADSQAETTAILLAKAETRAAELQVQHTQAEQQWCYELSSLQAATAAFEEFKVKASLKEAELERLVSKGDSQRVALESRLKATEEITAELEQALESSQSSAESFSEYSKLAESKVIQLSGTLSERDSEIEQFATRVASAESQLQQRDQAFQQQAKDVQALTEKYNAAESLIDRLNVQLQDNEEAKRPILDGATQAKLEATELANRLQQSEAKLVSKDAAIESHITRIAAVDASQSSDKAQLAKFESEMVQSKQKVQNLNDSLLQARLHTKELEEKLGKAESASQVAQQSLSELEQKRLSDAHKVNELQAQLTQTEASTLQTQSDSSELARLEEQVAILKNETSKYAAFQKDAQVTALELLEAKEQLKELEAHAQAAANASDSLSTSNIEIARLQKELDKAKRFQHELREQSVVLGKLRSQLKQSTDAKNTVDDYQTRMRSLEQQLKERDAELKTTQSQVEKNAKRDANRTDKAKLALAASKTRINELSKALSKAEARTKKAEQNDIELRRLRSELRALQAQRDKNVKSLDASTADTKAPDAAALKKLEKEISQRDRQIEQLISRLSDTQQATVTAATIKKKSKTRSNDPSAKHPQKSTVLFAVPKEKDNLKRIKGIGPVMEKTLNSLGITSFKQIADFSQSDTQRVADALETFPGRIERDDWVGGAKEQFKIKYKNKAEA